MSAPVRPPAIACAGVERRFGDLRALAGLDLVVPAGEIVALLGPSGCGKTTLLRLIAGFDRPDGGTIAVDGRTVAAPGAHVPPERRGIGMVFQDYALFPHLDVAANVGYGLGRRPARARVAEMLELVGLTGLEDRRPDELSGGQQQRVALARALAGRPAVVLLDEPFSNLDAALRVRLRTGVRQILREAGVAGLLVTHDQAEALSVGDRVAVVRDGAIVQEGRPEDVYERPATHWVAGFLGEVDVLPGVVRGGQAITALGAVPAPPGMHGPVDVLVRPEGLHLAGADEDGTPATVVEREYHGHDQLVTLRPAGGPELRLRAPGRVRLRAGDEVRIRFGVDPAVLPAQEPPARG